MSLAREIFKRDKALIGMVHVDALPGTPRQRLNISSIIRRAVEEARVLSNSGFDAVLLENMHDVPYLRRSVGPEITAAMTAVGSAVRQEVPLPMGIQILAGANHEAMAVAHTVGAQFIRAEGFVYSSVADEGLLDEADAGPLLRYRRSIEAEHVRVLADIKKKHTSHAITADIDLAETARAAEFFGADAVIVSGSHTSAAVSVEDLEAAQQATELPVVTGSGATPDNIATLFRYADAIIVGSWFKQGGRWDSEPDVNRVKQLVIAADKARD